MNVAKMLRMSVLTKCVDFHFGSKTSAPLYSKISGKPEVFQL